MLASRDRVLGKMRFWAQSTSLLSESAVFHRDERLAEWFNPFAFRESMVKDMLVYVGKLLRCVNLRLVGFV